MLMRVRNALLALVAIVMVAPIPSSRLFGGSPAVAGYGYQHGYRDGLKYGREDRLLDTRYDFHSVEYRHPAAQYEHYFGSKKKFKEGYREGYEAGYDDGYHGRPGRFEEVFGIETGANPDKPNPTHQDAIYQRRGWHLPDIAYNMGYRDGLEAGQMDIGQKKAFNPELHPSYRRARHGYRPPYGDLNDYIVWYRQGYISGYEDGYGETAMQSLKPTPIRPDQKLIEDPAKLYLNPYLNYKLNKSQGRLITGPHVSDGLAEGIPNYIFLFADFCYNAKRQAYYTMDLYKRYNNRVHFVIIDLSHHVSPEQKPIVKKYFTGFIPQTVLMDKNGKVVFNYSAQVNEVTLSLWVNAILRQTGEQPVDVDATHARSHAK